MVRTLVSYQCGRGSNSGVEAICGLRLLLVLSLATRSFLPVTFESYGVTIKRNHLNSTFTMVRTEFFFLGGGGGGA